VGKTRFWNNRHQVRTQANNARSFLGARKQKDIHMIATITFAGGWRILFLIIITLSRDCKFQ